MLLISLLKGNRIVFSLKTHIMRFFYVQVMQLAGVEGQQVYLLLEDHQITDIAFLDMVNSLLSSGEVSRSWLQCF